MNMSEKRKYERPLLKTIEPSMPSKTGSMTSVSQISEIDGMSLELLAAKKGTPLFVFSEQQIRTNIRNAKRAFSTRYPSVNFAWSYKTNYISSICKVFHEEGSWAEVVSSLEYQKALNNGCDPKKIIFNGPSKTVEDLRQAVMNDSLIHIDNTHELCRLLSVTEELNQQARVAVRINMNVGTYPQWDRFGFNLEDGSAWHTITQVMHEKRLTLTGIHCHIGTFILSADIYKKATMKMVTLACRLESEFSFSLQYIDLGGGFASKNTLKGSYVNGAELTPSMDDYAEAITSVLLKTQFPSGQRPMLILETGRALIDDAGYLLTSVLNHKRLANGVSNTVVDAGVNLLFTSFWYNHKVSVVQTSGSFVEETRLTGPLCMNIDVIRERVALPILNPGDLLLIHHVGAYNVTQWMQFIEYRPSVVMIADGKMKVIRRREDYDYVTSLES